MGIRQLKAFPAGLWTLESVLQIFNTDLQEVSQWSKVWPRLHQLCDTQCYICPSCGSRPPASGASKKENMLTLLKRLTLSWRT